MIEERLLELIRAALETAANELGIDGDRPGPGAACPPSRRSTATSRPTSRSCWRREPAGKPREVAEAIRAAFPEAPFVRARGGRRAGVPEHLRHRRMAARRAPRRRGERRVLRRRRAATAGASRWSSSVRTRPVRCTIGHARNAAIGDALASLLEHQGWDVEREYYFNDAGGQMDRFGAVGRGAATSSCSGRDVGLPEDGYRGDYVADIARDILEQEGPALADLPPRTSGSRACGIWAPSGSSSGIKATLERFGVRFDVYRSERELARGRGDRRRDRAAPRSRLHRTRPRARCGSARRRSATTRIAW